MKGYNGFSKGIRDDASKGYSIIGAIESASVGTPISFTGNIPDLQFTINEPITPVIFASEWSGNILPFSYDGNFGTNLPAGLTLNSSTCELSGTPTAYGTTTGHIIEGQDADTNSAPSNAFQIEIVPAAGDVQGQDIPSTGEDGPSPIYPSLVLPADNLKWYRFEEITPAASGTFTINPDMSATFDREGGPDGDYFVVIRMYEDNIALVPDITLTFTYATPTEVSFDFTIVAPDFNLRLGEGAPPVSFNFDVPAPDFNLRIDIEQPPTSFNFDISAPDFNFTLGTNAQTWAISKVIYVKRDS